MYAQCGQQSRTKIVYILNIRNPVKFEELSCYSLEYDQLHTLYACMGKPVVTMVRQKLDKSDHAKFVTATRGICNTQKVEANFLYQ